MPVNTYIDRGGLLIPTRDAATDQTSTRSAAAVPVDGDTDQVRALQAAAAEAERIRTLPTARVLARHQELAEADQLAALDAADHARRLAHVGARERAELAARAESATAKRRLESDVDVRALALSQRRRRWSSLAWTVLVLAMAFTCVNVQRFAATGTPVGSPIWVVAWGVDPLLSLLVVGLLLARGDLAVLGLSLGQARSRRGRRRLSLVEAVELADLGAVLLMNVAPELAPGVAWQSVCLHIVVPLAGMGAALVLPVVQQRYADAIASLYRQPRAAARDALAGLVDPVTTSVNPPALTFGPVHSDVHGGPHDTVQEATPATVHEPVQERVHEPAPEPVHEPAPAPVREPRSQRSVKGRRPTRAKGSRTGKRVLFADYLAMARDQLTADMPTVTPAWCRQVTGCSAGTSVRVAAALTAERASQAATDTPTDVPATASTEVSESTPSTDSVELAEEAA